MAVAVVRVDDRSNRDDRARDGILGDCAAGECKIGRAVFSGSGSTIVTSDVLRPRASGSPEVSSVSPSCAELKVISSMPSASIDLTPLTEMTTRSGVTISPVLAV